MNGSHFDVNNLQFPNPGGVDVSLGLGLDRQIFISDDFDYSSIDFNDPMLVNAFDFMGFGSGSSDPSGFNFGNGDPTAGFRVDTDSTGFTGKALYELRTYTTIYKNCC